VRLALIYALLDSADTIALEHLEAGLAVWRYSADSATWVLGDSLGDPTADEIWAAAKESPTGSRVAWKGAAPGQSKASFGRSHPGDLGSRDEGRRGRRSGVLEYRARFE